MPRKERQFNVTVDIRPVPVSEVPPAQRAAWNQFWNEIFGIKKNEEAVSSSLPGRKEQEND